MLARFEPSFDLVMLRLPPTDDAEEQHQNACNAIHLAVWRCWSLSKCGSGPSVEIAMIEVTVSLMG
jgi:hypothetical protein